MLFELGKERIIALQPDVDFLHDAQNMRQIGRHAAVRFEQGEPAFFADAGIIEVDLENRFAVFAHSYLERAALGDGGNIARIPVRIVQIQIFIRVQPEQGHGVKFAICHLAEKDRIFALQLFKFRNENADLIDAVAIVAGVAALHRQPGVSDIIDGGKIGHDRDSFRYRAKRQGGRKSVPETKKGRQS